MKKQPTITWRKAQRALSAIRNLPLFALCCITSIAIEVYAAGGIFQQTTATVRILGYIVPLAPVEATISLSCGLLAIWASFAAAKAKSDLRRDQRERAFGIRILSLALLLTPIYYAGNSFAFQKQLGQWQQYHGSAQEVADMRQANDVTLDSLAQRDAAETLKRSQRPLRAEFDAACMLWAAFLYGLNALAAGVCWVAKPETASEARRRADSERAIRAAKTRERNRKEAERLARQGQGGRFSVLNGGRA